jgi:hypothetical protein
MPQAYGKLDGVLSSLSFFLFLANAKNGLLLTMLQIPCVVGAAIDS